MEDGTRMATMPMSTCDNDIVYHKLDVMTSTQLNRLVILNFAIIIATFVHVAFLTCACNTIWAGKMFIVGVRGEKLEVRSCNPPLFYNAVIHGTDLIARLALIILSVIFTIRISRTKMRGTREQLWVVLMVLTTSLSYNPTMNLFKLHDFCFNQGNKSKWWTITKPWTRNFLSYNRAFNLLLSSIGQLFYIWCCTHSYGIVDEKERPSNLRFYGPKILLLSIYSGWRLALQLGSHISPSKLPGSSVVAMIANARMIKHWDSKLVQKVGVLSCIELIIVIAITRRVCITVKTLRNAEYLKYRPKQVGFRFFLAQNIVGFSLFFLADAVIMLGAPRDWEVKFLHSKNPMNILFNFRFDPIPHFLNYTATAITAYVNLPANSRGFMGWFRGSRPELNEEQAETGPITLKIYDSKEKFNVQHSSTTMNLELHVELYNASDLAYMLRSSNPERVQKAHDFIHNSRFSLELEIFNETKETYVIVLGSSDRIIVAFKGSTSVMNMKTDMKVTMIGIDEVLPTYKDSVPILTSTLDWKNARIHSGFSKAYASVSAELLDNIAKLQKIKSRPIYFTGHSLGGALCTLCSLDVALSLNIRKIIVGTFGSPRCGNLFWTRLYDRLICAHWRVTTRSDLIATLPRMGYAHVGKRVALTMNGEMFLDPNAIETALWSATVVSIANHKMPAYKEAIISFSSKYAQGFLPIFVEEDVEDKALLEPFSHRLNVFKRLGAFEDSNI